MVKNNPYKRQKLSSTQLHRTQEICLFPPTKYEETKATLKNFPSSIVNGVTVEGGLYSLTFKSINCATYVEQCELMKRAVVVPQQQQLQLLGWGVTRISKVDLKTLKEKLESEKKKEEEGKVLGEGEGEGEDKVGELLGELEGVLEKGGNGWDEFETKLKKELGSKVAVSLGDYEVVSNVSIPDVTVDSIDDVRNLDMSAYVKPEVPEVAKVPEVSEVAEVADIPEVVASDASQVPPEVAIPEIDFKTEVEQETPGIELINVEQDQAPTL
ncbi:hypothetical protein Cantr_08468 [Candida viswanathii]|uniref:Uncharacterized protein n=1 Tax=Candida viswanathii TaxID=5486 RepID=A0A367Y3J2_9ASCO|nr:hypothetical protein Cantr_08468 [Candida viswanathii]